MEIRSEYVRLSVSDGTTMRAWTARPKEESAHAGLIVFQEAFGVNAHIRDVAGRFAREGFVTIAPELFHRTAPEFEGRYDDFAAVTPHMKALQDATMAADQRAAFDWLRGAIGPQSPISAVGYCMGGRAAFLAAITLPLAAAVSYYGGGIAPNATNPGLLGRATGIQSPLLLFWGGRDKHIPPEQVRAVTDALRAAGKNFVNVEISNADHAFFCDARPSYSPSAALLAWPLTLAFLRSKSS
ncbi:MAG TPA: dienelactone hydrolase family protein [Candidatus Acidoferrum sp.]|nr:dienelactone hydrolase family protein [Candidatus Acidoferrum sp.]